jgi:hypothetical protein
MESADPIEVRVPAHGAQRLHGSFGAGEELVLVDVSCTGSVSTCSRAVRSPVPPQLQQAAFDAAPAIRAFRAAVPDGVVDASTAAIREAAAAVSAALGAAVPDDSLDSDAADSAAGGGGGANDEEAGAALAAVRATAWDLLRLLFIDRGADGVVAPALARWAHTHALVLGAGVTADVGRCARVHCRV